MDLNVTFLFCDFPSTTWVLLLSFMLCKGSDRIYTPEMLQAQNFVFYSEGNQKMSEREQNAQGKTGTKTKAYWSMAGESEFVIASMGREFSS